MKHFRSGLLLAAALALPPGVAADVIDFEGLSPGVNSGSVLAGAGVTFTTGTIPDSISVGDIITLAGPVDQFAIFQNANAISGVNFAVALGGGQNDLLIHFLTAVTFASVISDDAPGENPDIIRLIALSPTGNPNEFQVLAFDSALDNAVSSPDNILSVDLGGLPFSYVIFQTTTEQEGFDDLTFRPIRAPEPGSTLLMGAGLAALMLGARRRPSR